MAKLANKGISVLMCHVTSRLTKSPNLSPYTDRLAPAPPQKLRHIPATLSVETYRTRNCPAHQHPTDVSMTWLTTDYQLRGCVTTGLERCPPCRPHAAGRGGISGRRGVSDLSRRLTGTRSSSLRRNWVSGQRTRPQAPPPSAPVGSGRTTAQRRNLQTGLMY